MPIIIISAYYFAFIGYKFVGFLTIYIVIYVACSIYLTSKLIYIWKWGTKYISILPIYPKLFDLNEKYKAHLTIIFTYAISTLLATTHLNTKVVAILTSDFLIQALIISLFDFMLGIIILLPLFNQNSKLDYKILYENDIIDSALLKSITNNQPLILEYYLNENTSVYQSEDDKYRVLRHSNGNDSITYTVYEVIEKTEP